MYGKTGFCYMSESGFGGVNSSIMLGIAQDSVYKRR